MAKDVITRFKLETTGFDSKIKQAAKDLSAYSKTATQAKEGFNQFTKANIDAAKALGTMATSTTNVKDRAKELVGAFNDAAKAYNSLTKEQQQSDWAKALAGSLTQLQQRIKETKQEMQGLGDGMKGGGGLFSGIGSKMEGALAVFGGNLMTKAAGAVAQLGSEMADMVKQGVEMAKAGEGVRIAFERLGNGQILDGLREATHGTVTDLELMKAAVKFNDFKLPIEELGTMLAFAQQKAKDTGQSVDYMVDSIVTGLGRKSLMILDNLGLSATEIRERMNETGDMTKAVGAIIRDQMAKAGDYVETAADRAAQANVNMQNKMEELGRKFAPLQEASNSLWTSMKIGILDVIGGPLTDLLNKLTEAGRLKNALNNINGDGTKGSTVVANQLKQLQAAKKSGASQYMLNTMQSGVIEGYNRQINEREQAIKDWNAWRRGSRSEGLQERIGQWRDKYGTDVNSIKAEADAYRTMIAEYRKGAKDIMTPVTVDVKTDNAVKSLDELKVKLADLQAQRKKVAAGSDEAKRLDTEIRQVKADIKLQDPNALKTTTTTTKLDEIQKIQKKINDLTNEAYTADSKRVEEIQAEIAGLQEEERRLTAIRDLVTNKNNDPLKTLESQFPDMSKQNYNTGYAGSAQAKADSAIADFAQGGVGNADISGFISSAKQAIDQSELGDDIYNKMTEKLKDATMFQSVLTQAIAGGASAADLSGVAQEIKQKLLEGDIDESTWQEFLDKINELIQNADLKLTFDVDTKSVTTAVKQQKKETAEMAKEWQAAGTAIQAVGSAMSQIEDPATKVLGTIAQAVATMALSYSQAALATAPTGWGWIAFAATGLATMISSITAIKQATSGFANGGVIPGNSMSGDNLRGMTPDGTIYGLNSQEIILNRAQQGNLASQLEGGGIGNLHLDTVIRGEDIRLVLNNNGRRTGRGEYVQSRNSRG